MTDKDIEKLANKIADIIFKRQEEYDAQFQIDLNNLADEGLFYNPPTLDKKYLLPELEAELKLCIEKEDYKQAAVLANKIKKLKDEKS
jgi:hypothetical protein